MLAPDLSEVETSTTDGAEHESSSSTPKSLTKGKLVESRLQILLFKANNLQL